MRASLQRRVKARLGVRVLYLFCNNHTGYSDFRRQSLEAGTVGAFCESSSVTSFGCVPGNIFELVKHEKNIRKT